MAENTTFFFSTTLHILELRLKTEMKERFQDQELVSKGEKIQK